MFRLLGFSTIHQIPSLIPVNFQRHQAACTVCRIWGTTRTRFPPRGMPPRSQATDAGLNFSSWRLLRGGMGNSLYDGWWFSNGSSVTSKKCFSLEVSEWKDKDGYLALRQAHIHDWLQWYIQPYSRWPRVTKNCSCCKHDLRSWANSLGITCKTLPSILVDWPHIVVFTVHETRMTAGSGILVPSTSVGVADICRAIITFKRVKYGHWASFLFAMDVDSWVYVGVWLGFEGVVDGAAGAAVAWWEGKGDDERTMNGDVLSIVEERFSVSTLFSIGRICITKYLALQQDPRWR